VKLEDGSLIRVSSESQAKEIRDEVEEILSLGDILFGYGEFLENNHPLMPSGYCEEWWSQEVEKALEEGGGIEEDLEKYIEPPFERPDPELALKISRELKVPLHPDFTYNFHDLNLKEIRNLGEWLASGEFDFEGEVLKEVRVELESEPKRALEMLEVPHWVEDGEVVIGEEALPLCACLGLLEEKSLSSERLKSEFQENPEEEIMLFLEDLSGLTIRKKAPTWIGSRMGRPEKAKPRKMSPPPHVLFPSAGLVGVLGI